MKGKLAIAHLYPDLLNLYGDRGNVRCLERRLLWRGIEAETVFFSAGERVKLSGVDILVLGGGSDREQSIACRYLKENGGAIKEYVEKGGVMLAVCGGYQLLGNYYKTETETLEGLGILDIYTEWEPERLVGNLVLNSPLCASPVVGFENHGGRTYIGKMKPFGKVISGAGNTGASGYEGIIYKNVVGTYLHGPLLPKNPELCDWLIQKAFLHKYETCMTLSPLPDEAEHRANRYMQRRCRNGRRGRAAACCLRRL